MTKTQRAFWNLYNVYYIGGLFTFNGDPIPYTEQDAERDWEKVKKAINKTEKKDILDHSICPICKEPVNEKYKYCPWCGQAIKKVSYDNIDSDEK